MNELELILTDIFNCSRADLYLNAPSIVFRNREFSLLDNILKERGRTKPIQYALGYTEFMGLELKVKKGILIPRPETEVLVETVIERIQTFKPQPSKLKILDLGTGSGCIAIALAKFLKNIYVLATDISQEALEMARENTKLNNVEKNIEFLNADLFTPLESKYPLTGLNHSFFRKNIKFDVIVSNPPYVPTQEIGVFDISIANEPKIALDGGRDGFDFYRRINKEARRFLKKNGFLFLELGDGQANGIKEIFSKEWLIKEFIKDYQGIDRVCIIRNV